MPDQETLYPLEFFVAETPISLQATSKSRERWKATIKEVAQNRIRQTDHLGLLFQCPLALTIYYFPAAPMEGDIDNIVKPIMDALISVAYMDDNDVERVVIQKFEPDVDWDFSNPSDQLAAALEASPPVVYVRVDENLSWRML